MSGISGNKWNPGPEATRLVVLLKIPGKKFLFTQASLILEVPAIRRVWKRCPGLAAVGCEGYPVTWEAWEIGKIPYLAIRIVHQSGDLP